MGNTKQISIQDFIYYFFNDIINIKDFDSSLLTKKRQKIIQKHWYLQHGAHFNKKN